MLTIIGRKILHAAQTTGEMLALLSEIVYYFKDAPRNRAAIYRQMWTIGLGTLPIAALMSLFIGMVLALQTGVQLADYGTQ